MRRFASGDRVTVVHREDLSRSFTTSVENMVVERRFYEAPLDGQRRDWLVREVSLLEGPASAALRRIDEGAFRPPESTAPPWSTSSRSPWSAGTACERWSRDTWKTS
jgi:hypothetical protein